MSWKTRGTRERDESVAQEFPRVSGTSIAEIDTTDKRGISSRAIVTALPLPRLSRKLRIKQLVAINYVIASPVVTVPAEVRKTLRGNLKYFLRSSRIVLATCNHVALWLMKFRVINCPSRVRFPVAGKHASLEI